MKTINKMVVGLALVVLVITNGLAQAPMKPIEEGGKKPNKLEASKVPKTVTDIYILEYPSVVDYSWYGYPAFMEESDWYAYDPYLIPGEYPEYYIVEFIQDDTPHKVMYSKNGKRIATHRELKADLPPAVSNALSKGAYKNWMIKKEKEEIFKEKDTDKFKVYKIVVEKGKEKHALYYETDGTLLKDKKLKS
jgi:hypothetical protein